MSIIRGNIRQFGMIIALVAIAILFQILTDGILFMPANIANLVTQNGYILILAIGMMLVIITGRVDLSVGSLLAFTSAMSGIFIIQMELPVVVAILLVLGIGAISGAWNGFWIAYKNIPFFVVTLAGMLVFRGLTMTVLDGQTINPFPTYFHNMAAGFIPDFIGAAGINLTAIVLSGLASLVFVFFEWRSRRSSIKYEVEVLPIWAFVFKIILVAAAINLFGYWFAMGRGVPNLLILLVGLVVGYSFVTNKTVMGRHIYATGGDAKAAELSGIKVKRVVFWVYVNMGVLAALAGMVFAARLNASTPRAEAGFELQAIAASFIGGAGAYGGVGKITGAIIGAMMMGVLNNGLSLMGQGADIQLAITGVVLLIAVIFDVFTKRSQV
jgi:putative multiple sugar transport system permease protein